MHGLVRTAVVVLCTVHMVYVQQPAGLTRSLQEVTGSLKTNLDASFDNLQVYNGGR